jgi:Circularly permutated YpsA SLOG family
MLEKIVSGGQTGVDRGALDAALAASFPCGGWCPQGRRAEDGAIPERYPLDEMSVPGYRPRTRQNVIDSDATLIVFFGAPSGGTLETLRIAEGVGRPVLTLDASSKPVEIAAVEAAAFIEQNAIATLNVAGPRESTHAGSGDYARALVSRLLEIVRRGRA